MNAAMNAALETVVKRSAFAVEVTDNSKTGKVSASYSSQESCPPTCTLRGEGCYAEHGMMAIHTRRLNNSGVTDAEAIALEEAAAIDGLTGKRPLRIHAVGDCRTPEAADIIAGAAHRYTAKHDQPAWTYTHAWANVHRDHFGSAISVLASCESTEQFDAVRAAGYAPALVVDKHESPRAFRADDGTLMIPCPAQTHEGTQCIDCKLCWRADALLERKAAILFEVHSGGAKKARKRLS
jgi:hypothetical protein